MSRDRRIQAVRAQPKRAKGQRVRNSLVIAEVALSLVLLHEELTRTLEAARRSYEIIIVDDGSTDDSFQILARLQAADPRLRVIRFRLNFGQRF